MKDPLRQSMDEKVADAFARFNRRKPGQPPPGEVEEEKPRRGRSILIKTGANTKKRQATDAEAMAFTTEHLVDRMNDICEGEDPECVLLALVLMLRHAKISTKVTKARFEALERFAAKSVKRAR